MSHLSVIPYSAGLRVFAEVWAEYTALLEAGAPPAEAVEFMLDVEAELRTIYPIPASYQRIRDRLIDDPNAKNLQSSRAAIGAAFLIKGLWPVRQYFSRS